MSRQKNLSIAVLALASIGTAVVAWRQHAEIQRLSQARVVLLRASGPLVTLRSGEGQRTSVRPARSVFPAVEDSGEAASPGLNFGTNVRRGDPVPRPGQGLGRLLADPKFVQALTLSRQGVMDARFAGLFRQLNLSADELADFKRLLAEKEHVALDVVTISETTADGPLPVDTVRASIRAAQATVEDAILSSLGSDRYAVYREYERTVAQRATVAQLEQRLSYTGAPLTPMQAETLVRILVAHGPRESEAAPAVSIVVAAGSSDVSPLLHASAPTGRVTDQVVVQSQSVLSAEQLAALREIQAEQQAILRAGEFIRDYLPVADRASTNWNLLLQ